MKGFEISKFLTEYQKLYRTATKCKTNETVNIIQKNKNYYLENLKDEANENVKYCLKGIIEKKVKYLINRNKRKISISSFHCSIQIAIQNSLRNKYAEHSKAFNLPQARIFV